MLKKEFTEVYNRCLHKAELEYSWSVTEDEDEDAAVFVDARGDIFIKDIKTYYNCSMVEKIRFKQRFYNYEETGDEQDYYIKLWFQNGDTLVLGMKNYMDYVFLQLGREGAQMYYNKEVYRYWQEKKIDECEK